MRMKRFLTVLITLLVSLFFAPNTFSLFVPVSQDTVVRIERSAFTLTDTEDEIFSVDIVIENGQNVAGCQIWLTYNSTALEYRNSKEGAFFIENENTFYGEIHPDTLSPTETRLRFAVVTSPLSEHDNDGDIITLFFNVLDGNHPFLLNLVAGDLTNGTGTLFSDADGNLSVPQIENLPDLFVESVERLGSGFIISGKKWADVLIATLKYQGSEQADAPIHYQLKRLHRSWINIGEKRTAVTWKPELNTFEDVVLETNQSSKQYIVIDAPEKPGIYYYTVCIDSAATEHDTDKNCSDDYVKITVLPDLTGDGIIDENDFLIVVAQFGLDSAPATGNTITDPIVRKIYKDYHASGVISDFFIAKTIHADLNNDGIVDFADIKLMAEALADAGVFAAPNVARLTPDTVEQWMIEVKQMWGSNTSFSHGIAALEQFHTRLPPLATALLSNYPNPFNPETWIPYHLAKPADVTLTIYDVNGRIVRTLDVGHQRAGRYQDRARAAYWNGRNTHGEPVASGVYFYMLSAGDFTATRRMLIRK